MSNNSGYVSYENLEEYYLDDSTITGNIKSNSPSDPDYYPDEYNLVLCPPPSLSPTPSLTPTPTVTPSSPIPNSSYNVYINATLLSVTQDKISNVYYKINNGSWTFLGNIRNSICKNLGYITLNTNTDTLYLAMTTPATPGDNTANETQQTLTDYDINFYVDESEYCDRIDNTSSGYCGLRNPYTIQVTNDDVYVSLGAGVDKKTGNFLLCTGRISPTPSSSPNPYFSGIAILSSNYSDLLVNDKSVTINIISNTSIFSESTSIFSAYFGTISPGYYFLLNGNTVLYILTDGTSYATVINVLSAPPPPSITPTSTPSVSVGTIPSILAFGATLTTCYTLNDYISPYVVLNTPVLNDINCLLKITLSNNTTIQYPYYILAGTTTNSTLSNPCVSDTPISSGGQYPISVCIVNIDSSVTIKNTFGYCGGPLPTPSVTPSISPSLTPSITVSSTPNASITPTVTTTPSITPSISITRTPSTTPSLTPTITRSPSVTPTLTPSKTPTSTPAFNFRVVNAVGYGEITNVTDGSGNVFYNVISGNYPLLWNDTLTGTRTSVPSIVSITISNGIARDPMTLSFTKNGTERVYTIDLGGSDPTGVYNIDLATNGFTFNSTDVMEIIFG